jgi:hypothetical protein
MILVRAAIYDVASGVIQQIMQADPDVVIATIEHMPGTAGIEVAPDVSDSSHYVKAGQVVRFPPRTNKEFVWSPALEQWQDPRTLVQLRTAQAAIITRAAATAEGAGFSWNGVTWGSSPEWQSRITLRVTLAGLAKLQNQPFTSTWALPDGSAQTLNATQMIALGTALAAFVDGIGTRAKARLDAITAAATPAAVQAVVW